MNKFSKCVIVTGLIAALTGCGGPGPTSESRSYSIGEPNGIDNRLLNPHITDRDELLRKGDAGIGQGHSGGIHIMQQQVNKVWPNPAIAAYQGGYAENVIATASMFFGTPYEFGSDRNDPSTFDCSDFTRWAYLSALGMDLPKDSRAQARYVESFSNRKYWDISQAQRGDLLFFIGYHGSQPGDYSGQSKSLDAISHCGIYLGNGKMIHTASQRTGGVRIDDVFGNHLNWRFVVGGSVLE